MSRKVILYIAMSLDGYIAAEDGKVDFLEGHHDGGAENTSYSDFSKEIDTVIMGRTTYNQIITQLSPDVWVYDGLKSFVVTTTEYQEDKNVEFVDDKIIDIISELKQTEGKNIWLIGGSKVIDLFMQNYMIDEYIITIIPTILGSGIPLFNTQTHIKSLKKDYVKTFGDFVEIKYSKS